MISTHILDTSIGAPVSNIVVSLLVLRKDQWVQLSQLTTDKDGRIRFECPIDEGNYQLNFKIEDYYQDQSIDSFFLDTNIKFKIKDTSRNYHVPLLLNPFGYATYRGS